MHRNNSVSIISAIALSVLAANPAQADECSSKQNFMVMPNGKCIVLNYLGILATSREVNTRVDNKYQQQFDANLELETNSYNLRTETKESRDRRLKNLAASAESKDKINKTAVEVEDILYPLHQRAMGIVREGFRR